MYCSYCRRRLFYKDLENHTWCEHCEQIVSVSPFNVSYWTLAAVFAMLWALPVT
jgi:hypothetical protein